MKSQIIETLREYFTSKGKVMTMEEYKAAEDTPIRYQIVKRRVGTWARVTNLVGEIKAPEVVVPPVVETPKTPAKPEVKK